MILDESSLEHRAADAIRRGDVASARDHLKSATAQTPQRGDLWLSLAACHRRLGELGAALTAVDRALVLDARDFIALLTRASLLEAAGDIRSAGIAYGLALKSVPENTEGLIPQIQAAIKHAHAMDLQHRTEMERRLLAEAERSFTGCSAAQEARVRGFLDDLLGKRKRFRQEPTAFFYPGLPSIAFYDRETFPWLQALEAAAADIAAEAEQLMRTGAGFAPYVDIDDSLPVDQWRDLNQSARWSAFHLFQNGRMVEENGARCPKTIAALKAAPQPQHPGRSPSAMFSVLAPKTIIPPHTGVSNTRLVVHLPLIVPDHCRFRVGNETRTWKRGEAWVFDDTIEHEAVNDSDEPRLILIFDIWQPLISAVERDAIVAITQAMDAFGGVAAPSSL